MAQVTIGDELRDQLMQSGGVVELYDARGVRIGTTYVTAPEPTLDELRAMSARVTARATAEQVSERLRGLTKCE